jgi:hypothetical protein
MLISTVMGAVTKEATISPLSVVETGPSGQCQNIRMQQRQIFEKMTRIEDQLDAKDVID